MKKPKPFEIDRRDERLDQNWGRNVTNGDDQFNCPRCGALVSDDGIKRHIAWHQELRETIAKAIYRTGI